MYPPPAFREDDTQTLHALMQEAGLCTLVTHSAAGLMATPLPVWLEASEGEMGTIYAHVARANPQAQAAGEGLVIFPGPDAYVSPSWYPAKAEHHKVVPTWNYVAVQAYGPVETFDDAESLRTLVTRLTQRHEAGRAEPWAVSDAPDAYIDAMLRGIVGVRIAVTRLDGRRKLSQNRAAADQAGVARGLSGSAREADRAVAGLMRGEVKG